VESGTWMVKSGEICFDNKTDPVRCWTTIKPDAKGKFNSISTDGKMTAQGTKRPA
jgi:hypothetical protein